MHHAAVRQGSVPEVKPRNQHRDNSLCENFGHADTELRTVDGREVRICANCGRIVEEEPKLIYHFATGGGPYAAACGADTRLSAALLTSMKYRVTCADCQLIMDTFVRADASHSPLTEAKRMITRRGRSGCTQQ